ncbi:MAG: plastocyanin/azurin family copper-binding protein [Phycisphaeraceae bacterium]
MSTLAWVRFDKLVVMAVVVALFSAPARGHVHLHAPNGAEVLEVGSEFAITWHIHIAHSLQNWDLWYSTTGAGGPWIAIATNLPAGSGAAGSIHTYDWTVPDAVSDRVRVRVRMDNYGTDYYDTSDADFSIVPAAVEVIVEPGGKFVFLPDMLVIDVGDTVRWIWDGGGHNVVSGSPGVPDGAFYSGLPAPAGTIFEVVFDQAFLDANPVPGGLYDYYCEPHADFGMIGSIDVSLPCPADFNGDDQVGPFDLAILLGAWGPCPGCPTDLSGDGVVGPFDLATLLGAWGPCL